MQLLVSRARARRAEAVRQYGWRPGLEWLSVQSLRRHGFGPLQYGSRVRPASAVPHVCGRLREGTARFGQVYRTWSIVAGREGGTRDTRAAAATSSDGKLAWASQCHQCVPCTVQAQVRIEQKQAQVYTSGLRGWPSTLPEGPPQSKSRSQRPCIAAAGSGALMHACKACVVLAEVQHGLLQCCPSINCAAVNEESCGTC